jgi:WD40 repeat protein
VTGSYDKTARLWDLKAKDPAASPLFLRGHEGWVSAVEFSSDNHWLVTGSAAMSNGFFGDNPDMLVGGRNFLGSLSGATAAIAALGTAFRTLIWGMYS